MSSTNTILKQRRSAAAAQFGIARSTRKLARPVSRLCAAREGLVGLAAQEQILADDPSLADSAASLAAYRFCLRLFICGLCVLVIGELVFIMPALIGAVGAISGGFGTTGLFVTVGSVVLLATLTISIVMLKRTLPPLNSNLRDAFDIEVSNAADQDEVERAFRKRNAARRHAGLNLVVMVAYLMTIAWIMQHNLSAGRLFLDRIEALEADSLRATAVSSSLGDELFPESPLPGTPTPTPTPTVAAKKNPQTAVLGLFLLLHTVLLVIPLDFKMAEIWRQELAAKGVSDTPAVLLRRRCRLQNRLLSAACAIQHTIANHDGDAQSRDHLQTRILALTRQFEETTRPTGPDGTATYHREDDQEIVPTTRVDRDDHFSKRTRSA